ncbi:MAG: hypothetical protein V1725_05185 [archaeon]
MVLKQISVNMPDLLFEAAKEHSEKFGYRNVQELILETLRQRVIQEKDYAQIETRMKKGKGVKRFNQQDALAHVRGL